MNYTDLLNPRRKIRPNAIDFLLKAYKLGYEIVVFSDQHMLNAVDQVEQLQTLMGLKEGFSLERVRTMIMLLSA